MKEDLLKLLRYFLLQDNNSDQLGTNIHSTEKRVIWIDGGIHAREWAAVHTTLYFIDRVRIFQD